MLLFNKFYFLRYFWGSISSCFSTVFPFFTFWQNHSRHFHEEITLKGEVKLYFQDYVTSLGLRSHGIYCSWLQLFFPHLSLKFLSYKNTQHSGKVKSPFCSSNISLLNQVLILQRPLSSRSLSPGHPENLGGSNFMFPSSSCAARHIFHANLRPIF